MSLALLEVLDGIGRNSKPLRWYHFIGPLAFVAFVLFCVGFTLWSLFA